MATSHRVGFSLESADSMADRRRLRRSSARTDGGKTWTKTTASRHARTRRCVVIRAVDGDRAVARTSERRRVLHHQRRPLLDARARKFRSSVLRTVGQSPALQRSCSWSGYRSVALVCLVVARWVLGRSQSRYRHRQGRGRPRLDDPRRSGRAQRHRLQLRHRARARRAQHRAPARDVRPELHGHRRDREPCDRPFSFAQRAVARQRARAELRIRSARAREAAAQVRRPRRDARAHAPGERHDRGGRSHGAPAELQQSARVAHQRRDRDRPARRPHSVSRAAGHALHAADVNLDARQRRRHASPCRGGVSRRQTVVECRLRPHRGARRQSR